MAILVQTVPHQLGRIDLIHDTRHLCTRSRIDGIKAMSRGTSRGKQVIKIANTSNHCRVCLFYQNETTIFNKHAKFRVGVSKSFILLFVVRKSTVATAFNEIYMINFTHTEQFAITVFKINVLHLLLSRIRMNKLDRHLCSKEVYFTSL